MLKIISDIKKFLKENNCRMNNTPGCGVEIYIPTLYGNPTVAPLGLSLYTGYIFTDPIPCIEIPIYNHDSDEMLILTASLRYGLSSNFHARTIDVNISYNNSIIMRFSTDIIVGLSEIINDYNISNNVYLLSVLKYFK